MADNERDDSLRPDPDALLALAEKDRRGKLTVFVGAAPGVGKTYAMLTRAGRLKAEGVDLSALWHDPCDLADLLGPDAPVPTFDETDAPHRLDQLRPISCPHCGGTIHREDL